MAKKKTIEEVVIEQTETETVISEVIDETPKTHTVSYGETWVSISELYKGKETNNSYAKKLTELNGNKNLTNGSIITLP